MGTTREQFDALLDEIQAEERKVRDDGQREYTVGANSPFYNFEQVGSMIPCPHCGKPVGKYVTLMVYALKHIFGILSWVGGHKSQREDVRGRIKDARMYFALLRGMVEEDETEMAGRLHKTLERGEEGPRVESERIVDIGVTRLVDVASSPPPNNFCLQAVPTTIPGYYAACAKERGHGGPCASSWDLCEHTARGEHRVSTTPAEPVPLEDL